MKLYSGPLSLFTAKVRIALAEKGLDYEIIPVPYSRADRYSPKLPEMLAINPKGEVPVLIDGDLEVYDSTIILEYLEEKYPVPPLYPSGAAERARCRQAEAAADEIFFPLVWPLVEQLFYQTDEARRDAAIIAEATAKVREAYDRLDARLSGREYFCNGFTVADVAYFLTIMYASTLGAAPAAEHRNLNAWMARVSERPSVAAEIESITKAAQAL